MKKKIFGFLMLTALCVVTVVKVSVDRNSVGRLVFLNVEALAGSESGDISVQCMGDENMGKCVVYCIPCDKTLVEKEEYGPSSATGRCPHCGESL